VSFDNYKNITLNQRYTCITAIKLFSWFLLDYQGQERRWGFNGYPLTRWWK
jgi:hypothetical protein